MCLLHIAVPALGPEPAILSLPAPLVLLGLPDLGATLPGVVKLGGLPVGLLDTGVSWVSVCYHQLSKQLLVAQPLPAFYGHVQL